jgi:two-component system phosphate regulon sensor histidine kinase PhoR
VKHVAQRHEARLDIESRPGLGSTFSITLPHARVRASGPAESTARLAEHQQV